MEPSGDVLCLIPDANAPGKRDMSGAFLPEALAFCTHYGADQARAVRRFPAHATFDTRRDATRLAVETRGRVSTVAFFCHGFRRGIQAGYTRAHVREFVDLLQANMAPERPRLILYACDTGRDLDSQRHDDRVQGPGGDHGFADRVRDVAERLGMPLEVTAHTTAGHTTRNPYVRRFSPGTGGSGGQWIVEPHSPAWTAWRRALHEPGNTLRFRMPFMTFTEVRDELLTPSVG